MAEAGGWASRAPWGPAQPRVHVQAPQVHGDPRTAGGGGSTHQEQAAGGAGVSNGVTGWGAQVRVRASYHIWKASPSSFPYS